VQCTFILERRVVTRQSLEQFTDEKGNCPARNFLKVLAMKCEQAGFCLPYTSISSEYLLTQPPEHEEYNLQSKLS